jgi:hypothetical protein
MTDCKHPKERQMYYQLNLPDGPPRITVTDLLGGINPYLWRIEYCWDCGEILKSYGDVPQHVRDQHRGLRS